VAVATCDEIRLQLAATRAELDQAAADVISARGSLAELESESTHVNPKIIAAAAAELAAAEARLSQLGGQLESLKSALVANKCLRIQPAGILEIRFDNPTSVKNVDPLFAQTVAFGRADTSLGLGGTFPSLDARQEWKQVLPADLTNTDAHNQDHEVNNLVGAGGWALDPRFSGGDVPFTHPFGTDWEFLFALDQPADEPDRYTFLLTSGDQSCDEEGFADAVAQAGNAKDPHGKPIIPQGPDGLPSLLGREIDGGLLPRQFTDQALGGVEQGDRVAVFGRWIVDCGHQVPITDCADPPHDAHPGEQVFRTEIHPPLLMAAARVASHDVATPAVLNTLRLTRVLVTSRPYLVSQRFTIDTDAIYDDTGQDDGAFVDHMISEVVKVNETILGIPTSSIQVEAHPKIKSNPFVGTYRMQLIVRPPAPNPLVGHGPLGVAFQFTVRRGCTVEVGPGDGDSINVVITMTSDDYRPPPLPSRHERTWSIDELRAIKKEAADAIRIAQVVSAGIQLISPSGLIGAAETVAILDRGIVTDEYDTSALLATNILDAGQAIVGAASSIRNLDVQGQLAQLRQERSETEAAVTGDEGDLAELLSESQHVNPKIIAAAQKRLTDDRARLTQLDQQIAALEHTPVGVVTNNGQPFPVFGWIEVGYLDLVAQQ
jgi:hypothetical protein